jgi:hypothetical protein
LLHYAGLNNVFFKFCKVNVNSPNLLLHRTSSHLWMEGNVSTKKQHANHCLWYGCWFLYVYLLILVCQRSFWSCVIPHCLFFLDFEECLYEIWNECMWNLEWIVSGLNQMTLLFFSSSSIYWKDTTAVAAYVIFLSCFSLQLN